MEQDEFTRVRERRIANNLLMLQAAALIKLYKQVHGRDALDLEELEAWAPQGSGAIDPYDVLTEQEIQAMLR